METKLIDWLVFDSPFMKLAVERQLLGLSTDSKAALADTRIRSLISRLKSQEGGLPALKTRKLSYISPGNAFWDLFFLADLGFTADELGLQEELEEVFKLQNNDGTFMLQADMKPGYFCITSIMLTSLVKLGYKEDPRILVFIDRITESKRLDGGWHCALNRQTGKKLEDTESCPMDNLNILMLLSCYEKYRNDSSLKLAISLLLGHWNRRKEPWRPYGFGIGSDFMKLKYPAVKYGILRMLDVLSLYPASAETPEFKKMLSAVKDKAVEGKYIPESVSRAYSDFDFGQTKAPSTWLSFLVYRIEKQAGI